MNEILTDMCSKNNPRGDKAGGGQSKESKKRKNRELVGALLEVPYPAADLGRSLAADYR